MVIDKSMIKFKMSSVKNHFEVKEDSLTCKVCKKAFSLQATGTTSHLWSHLERKHPSVYQQAKTDDTKKKTLVSAVARRHSLPMTEGRAMKKQTCISAYSLTLDASTKKKYDAAVLKFIVADGRPFESAAGSGFKNLCSVLTSGRYQPPHPTTLSRKLDDMANNLHQKLVQFLRSEINDCRPSITFDHWKADNKSNYLVLTIHYISESSWVMQSRCLSVVNLENLEADHTARKTSEIISNEFAKHGFGEEKILFATTDTTNTMPCTAKILDIQWHGCAAHILQLTINAALDVQRTVKNLIGCLHYIAGFFHSSTVGQAVLTKYQVDKGLPESKPPLDVTTRFNSTYLLMDWVSRNYESISLALVDCAMNKKCARSPPQPLSTQLQDTLKNVLPLLKPTAEATTILSADTHVSVSLIIPCISVLKEELASATLATPGIQCFRNELLRQLNTRFDLSKDYLLAATFIDPRFKTVLFPEHQVTQAKVYIENIALSTSSPPWPTTSNSSSSAPESNAQTSATDSAVQFESTVVNKSSHKGSLLDSVFKKVDDAKKEEATSTWSTAQQLESEVSAYLKQPISERDSDPLQYWKENKSILPLLSSVARNLLAIQATNCSSERVNSVGGQIITDLRYNLSRTNAETLIWARNNKDLLLF
uniref:BED-type domain-containing protein n=1 Tax=Leptobrachium leishanense TaxID=445787 RepID=A0A8C5LLM5_9ANUR